MSRASAALLAALALVAANAAKPLVVDDAAYVAFARQALAHPGDPFGFDLYWYQTPQPAMRDSVPAERFRQEDELTAVSRSPWSTIPVYYDGPVPLRRQRDTQTVARIFRVKRDWVSHVQAPRQ